MEKINFENYPSINSPINATNLNLLQDNIEDEFDIKDSEIGDLNNLNTTDKSNLVNAINESITKVKLITFTRLSTADSESVSYNVDFKPKFLIALMIAPDTLYWSKGVCDTDFSINIYQSAENLYRTNNNLITYSNYSSWAQSAVLSAFDEDGFTLNWTKIGEPPNAELQLIFIAIK